MSKSPAELRFTSSLGEWQTKYANIPKEKKLKYIRGIARRIAKDKSWRSLYWLTYDLISNTEKPAFGESILFDLGFYLHPRGETQRKKNPLIIWFENRAHEYYDPSTEEQEKDRIALQCVHYFNANIKKYESILESYILEIVRRDPNKDSLEVRIAKLMY